MYFLLQSGLNVVELYFSSLTMNNRKVTTVTKSLVGSMRVIVSYCFSRATENRRGLQLGLKYHFFPSTISTVCRVCHHGFNTGQLWRGFTLFCSLISSLSFHSLLFIFSVGFGALDSVVSYLRVQQINHVELQQRKTKNPLQICNFPFSLLCVCAVRFTGCSYREIRK